VYPPGLALSTASPPPRSCPTTLYLDLQFMYTARQSRLPPTNLDQRSQHLEPRDLHVVVFLRYNGEKVDGAVNYRKITMNVRKTLCSPSCIGGDTTVREANPATISSAHKGTGQAETTPLQLRGCTQHRELEREGHFATRAPEHTAEALHAPRGPGTSRSKSSAKFPEVPARNALRNVRETVGP
jgi:hypothetical protein